jgi:lipoprotein-releasing system permease protein
MHYLRGPMNLTKFIAKRIASGDDRKQISAPIVRIATWGIAVGVALMLLSLSVVQGFQEQIRNKVIGFGSHFQVTPTHRSYSKDSQKMAFDPEVMQLLKSTPGVRHVQTFASKPGIIETEQGIQGIVTKGIGADFDSTFLCSNLIEGRFIHSSSDSMEVVLSSFLANRLGIDLNDKISIYVFTDNADPRQRNFRVCGIYNTGLEDYDRQFVFLHMNHIQRLAGWGIRAEGFVDSLCYGNQFVLGAVAFGGDGDYSWKWSSDDVDDVGPHYVMVESDTTITAYVNDDSRTLGDTVYFTFEFDEQNPDAECSTIPYTIRTSGGSDRHYIGGYEVLLENYDELIVADDALFAQLTTKFLQTQKITDRNPEIFSWLKMLDINVIIIIVLMIVISIVNMTSALLIIILERQSMIGTLKAMGIEDRSVMLVFVRHAGRIIGRGMLIGNIIGIGLAALQYFTGIFELNPENYYLDRVPIAFDVWSFVGLNLATLIICLISMLLPARYVTKISPIKAMRFS